MPTSQNGIGAFGWSVPTCLVSNSRAVWFEASQLCLEWSTAEALNYKQRQDLHQPKHRHCKPNIQGLRDSTSLFFADNCSINWTCASLWAPSSPSRCFTRSSSNCVVRSLVAISMQCVLRRGDTAFVSYGPHRAFAALPQPTGPLVPEALPYKLHCCSIVWLGEHQTWEETVFMRDFLPWHS